jgi:hypothetical protein
MLKRSLLSILTLVVFSINSQTLQSPDQFLGYPIGTYFSRHHQVVDYFKQLEKNAPNNVRLEQYGTTNEHRELLVAYISSEENLKNLEQIKADHGNLNKDEKITLVWLSYNVHGNESSGTEAAMLTAYELISQKQEWLKNTVVILDPCINPDGRDRYVNWFNQYQNKEMNVDRMSAEHSEPWPGGRPNHYLFDLNRDWAWLTQKESQERIALYNQWLPHVHADFHEQSINEPYYFAPAAEPYHEVITKWQREFQNGVGKNNAKYFDQNGWFYFTKEFFDLLYPSYGDTYPIFSGAIGMTYEQGGSSSAGLGVINRDGDTLTLVDRIQHHHTAGLSTVEYAHLQSQKLITEFQNFANNKNYKYKSFIVGGNPDRIQDLRKLLDGHKITYSFGGGASVKGYNYATRIAGSMKVTENHLIISTNQIKGTLVNVLFEPKTKLVDSLTYDITAWSLPYAYGLDAIASETLISGFAEKVVPVKNDIVAGAYAYLCDWNSMKDARFMTSLLQKGIRVRYAENPFSLAGKNYDRGTLIIAKGDNESATFAKDVTDLANTMNVQLTATSTGMVDSGNDFGSSSVKLIPNQKIMMLSGAETSSLNVGEVWHFFEEQLHYPLTVIDFNDFSFKALDKFNVLIVPEGWYGSLSSPETHEEMKNWISNGGKVIAIGEAVHHFTTENGYSLKSKSPEQEGEEDEEIEDAIEGPERHEHAHIKYNEQEREEIKNTITGAIMKCKVEQTNPLAFGYGDSYYSLKLTPNAFEWLEDGGNVVYLDDKPEVIAGFAGSEALKNQPKSLIFGQENMGNGSLIYLIDNPLFRGFWENGKLFFVNALFLTNN